MNIACIQFLFYTQLGQWLDYLHAKLRSVMNFRPASGDENVRKLGNFMLGCDLGVSLVVKNHDLACW